MVGPSVFPDARVLKMLGPSVFPDSRVLKMLGPSVFPDTQVMSKWWVLQYFHKRMVYQNGGSFSVSRKGGYIRMAGPSVFPEKQVSKSSFETQSGLCKTDFKSETTSKYILDNS